MVTVPEAARRTGRNPETIRRWIREGKLPARKVGTQHLIEEEDLREVLGVTVHRVGRAVGEAVAPYGVAGLDPAKYRRDWLPAIVGRIVRAVDPVRIVLFGSRARGDARPDSDYDLLVVLDAIGHRRETRITIARTFADLPVAVDIAVSTPDELAEGSVGIAGAALRDGVTVYERAPGS